MTDDDLQRLLRESDPAAAVPPLTAVRLDDLTEHAMTTTAPHPSTDRDRAPAPRRTRRRLLIGGLGLAAAAAVAALVVPLALGTGTPGASGGSGVALTETPTDPLTAACAPVSADAVAQADLAFRARVADIDDGRVVLDVLEVYRGRPGSSVTVTQPEEGAADGSATTFAAGGTYLVASADGLVLSCGLTGADSPELRAVYAQAFG